ASAPELPQRLTAETLLSGFRWADVALGEGVHEHKRIEEVRAAPTGELPIAALDFPVVRPDPKPREDKVIITRDPDDIDAFRVAQQPVTNAQFAVFLQDPAGYANKTWWDYNPAARRSRPDIPPPPGTPGDDDPRTMVNWWMAVAFALWLSARLGEDIRLPTGEKWRRAVERRNRAVDGLREWGCYADSNSPIALFRWGKIRPAVYAVDAVNRRQDLTGAEMAGDLGFRMIHTGLPFDGLAGPGIG
ncbi:MAG: SUMF1/EgtB/PvdO family nonheme iron enzyme, partial [Anaerolineae bacterium]|nr:SUMF1/EgtB/PvdO family nonheme iron enzyme [Anaerolineae bacterium]